jgi:hypothetical protein
LRFIREILSRALQLSSLEMSSAKSLGCSEENACLFLPDAH